MRARRPRHMVKRVPFQLIRPDPACRHLTLRPRKSGRHEWGNKVGTVRAQFTALLLLATWQAHPAVAGPGAPGYVRWAFKEDFSHGIPGWMSFPLPQDVGYDPSLYTATEHGTPVLVRDVIAQGERRLRVGLIRPLRFRATPGSLFRISYELSLCGQVRNVRLTLAGLDGRRYSFPLPAGPGAHDVGNRGTGFQPALGEGKDVGIEALVVEAEALAPPPGSHNRLTLRAVEVSAERPAALPIEAPALERSVVDDIAVARVLTREDLKLEIKLGAGPPARASLYDPTGQLAGELTLRSLGEGGQGVLRAPATMTRPGLWRAAIESGEKRSDFRLLVLGRVPDHPRILLTAQRLEQLRSEASPGNAGAGSNELLGVIHRRAAELRSSLAYNSEAGRNVTRLSPVSVFSGLIEYFALMENYSNSIAFNAIDFRLHGDREAFEAARRGLLAVAAWDSWTHPWFPAHGLHTYYEVGVFTQRVALAYDLIADQLTPDEKSRIADGLWRNSIRPTLDEYFFFDRMPIAASNHMANSVGGAIAACVALLGDVPDREETFATALAELITCQEHVLENLFPADGSGAEPAGYENFGVQGTSWGLAALDALGIRPEHAERMEQAFWWLRYAEVSPDLLLDTGDFHGGLKGLSGFAWAAEHSTDPALRAFYDRVTDASLAGQFHVVNTGRTLEQAPGLLDLVCCTKPAAASPAGPGQTTDWPLSRIFPERGSAVLRSGWHPQATVISIRAGPWFNHEHHDQGSFQVAAWGEEVIDEAGYADYYRDPHYPDYFIQASGHNTVLVDNNAFSQGDYDGRYWRALQQFPRFIRHVFSAGIDYLAVNLAPAYGGRLNAYTREFLFLKPDILVVRDRLQAPAASPYSWILHVPPEAGASVDATGALIRGKAALATMTAAGRANHLPAPRLRQAGWTLVETPNPGWGFGDLDRAKIVSREAFRLDAPASKEAEFLVGMRFQKASEAPAPLRTLSDTSSYGFSEQGHGTAVFRIGAGPLTVGDVSADGEALAVRENQDSLEIFVQQARSVSRGKQLLLSSSAPVEVVITKHRTVDEVNLVSTAETDVKILTPQPPAEVKLDERLIEVHPAGSIALKHLRPGEHVVTIAY